MSKLILHKSSPNILPRKYIIVFHAKKCIEFLPARLNNYYQRNVRRYSLKSGIPVDIWQDTDCIRGTDRLITQIASTIHLTPREMACLRDATEIVFRSDPKWRSLSEVLRLLKESEAPLPNGVAEKIYSICGEGFFREGEFFSDGCNVIYEVDFNSVDLLQQNILQEFFLSVIHSWGMSGKFLDRNLLLFIDEIQDISIKPGSPLNILLNQGRKLGINLVLARPDINFSRRDTAALYQCAFKGYFRPPSNSRRIAKEINPRKVDKIAMQLNSLRRGEFLLDGDVSINGTEVGRQQIVVSPYVSDDTLGGE